MEPERKWTSIYPINIRSAKTVVDGDRGILVELFEIFLEHLPEQLENLESAIHEKDGSGVQFFAHQLKGAMRNFGAEYACEKAFQLEKAGKENKFMDIGMLYSTLEDEIAVIKDYINSMNWEKYFKQ